VKFKRVDELIFHFKGDALSSTATQDAKSSLTGLTFIHASSQNAAKRLLTADFHANPNVFASFL
jgi:hypothetical protein